MILAMLGKGAVIVRGVLKLVTPVFGCGARCGINASARAEFRSAPRFSSVFSFLVVPLLFSLVLLSVAHVSHAAEKPEEPALRFRVDTIDISLLRAYPEYGLGIEALEDALKTFRAKYPPGVTLEELQLLGDDFTQLYRSHGLKFHSVYLPPQKLLDRYTVSLALLEATLGDVHVRGSDEELNSTIDDMFADEVGRALYQPAIDQLVLGLKAQFGVETFSYYSRGRELGQMRLNIKAEKTKSGYVGLRYDNFGTESTGEERVTVFASGHSLLREFDSFSVAAQQAVDGEQNIFGTMTYTFPFISLDHSLGLSVSNNVFDVGGEFSSLEIEGDALLSSVRYAYIPIRRADQKQELSLSLNHKTSDYENVFRSSTITQDETVTSADLTWALSYRPIASSWSYGLFLTATGGEYELGELGDAESFSKYRASQLFEWSFGSPSQRLFNTFRWQLKGQYSEDKLPSFEKLAMSGVYGIRDFKAGYFSADRGAITSLEWWWPGILGFGSKNFQFTPFMYGDYGFGEQLDIKGGYLTSVELNGAGLGLRSVFFNTAVLSVSGGRGEVVERNDNPKPEAQDLLFRLDLELEF
jgi:hemolysin activation/secretion protein